MTVVCYVKIKMSRTVTQETFDDVVTENIEEFCMEPDEAIEDAVKQFEAQGVDLSNIVKNLVITSKTDGNLIGEIIAKLKSYDGGNTTEIINDLDALKTECNKDISSRVIAGKHGAYDVILQLMQTYHTDKALMIASLQTIIALMTGQPDLLTSTGVEAIIACFEQQRDEDVHIFTLKWARECCIKHENNRQKIFEAAILNNLKALLVAEVSASLLRNICGVLRALVLDDDVRVEFGKAHEHARIIAGDTLHLITSLLTKYKHDEGVVNDLIYTLTTLIVRNEFCNQVEDAGGLDFLLEAFKLFPESEKINRSAFKLLKVLAGNDDCKAHIIQKGAAPLIANALTHHSNSASVVTIGLNSVAALTLRSTENSKVLFENGLAEIIVQCMQLYPNVGGVQKSASWAVRNMVSRSRNQNDKFLELGIEVLLQDALKSFKEYEYDIKAALRDLDCKVNFKEEWTGKGGKIYTQDKQS